MKVFTELPRKNASVVLHEIIFEMLIKSILDSNVYWSNFYELYLKRVTEDYSVAWKMKAVLVTINFIRMDYVVLRKIIVSSNLIDFQNPMEIRSKLNVYKNLCNVLEYGKWLTYVQVKFCINVEVNILNYQALWRLSMASWQIGVRAKFLCNTQKVQINCKIYKPRFHTFMMTAIFCQKH